MYKLAGLYVFGDQKIIFPSVLTDFFHMGILRTGFFMFNKNLLNTLHIVLDSLRKSSKSEALTNFLLH